MKTSFKLLIITAAAFMSVSCTSDPASSYRAVFGNTHSHCNYSGDIAIFRGKKGLGLDPGNTPQGHYGNAKAAGYDFYCITDHSQYPCYTEEAWADIQAQAEAFTDENFVALRGYEHSENDGPDGRGHMNVWGSTTFLNALADSVSIEFFQNWLATKANKEAFAGFNHPKTDAYNDFHCYDEAVRDRMKLIELINGKNPKFYKSFLKALSLGWKVSPVAGCDNHDANNIAKWPCRTGLLVTALTPDGVLDAMRSRRTWAMFDKNMDVRYSVNGVVMGSEIPAAAKYKFNINICDPDEDQVINKVEIVGEDGAVLASEEFSSNAVEWKPVITENQKYFFVLVYTEAYPEHPTAYVAPVWVK
ncbi:MAG: hypothetical protein IJS07_00405 [Bacteroidales bacterium]|nr:hypothetical protein [Bacteroidales bacterium]